MPRGFEAFINHVHLDDELELPAADPMVLVQAGRYATELADRLERAYPGEVFVLIIGLGDSCTVRFHKLRPGESWIADDLEGYENEAMMVVQSRSRRQVLFIQGGGAGAHDEWDVRLVDDLQRALGERVRGALSADAGRGRPERRELERGHPARDGGAGRPCGGGRPFGGRDDPDPRDRRAAAGAEPAAIVLVAAPFVGEGGWPGDEFELSGDLGAHLPRGMPVYVFHGLDDETAPPLHADLYAQSIPQARVHRLPARDHQLNDDLSEVATAIRAL